MHIYFGVDYNNQRIILIVILTFFQSQRMEIERECISSFHVLILNYHNQKIRNSFLSVVFFFLPFLPVFIFCVLFVSYFPLKGINIPLIKFSLQFDDLVFKTPLFIIVFNMYFFFFVSVMIFLKKLKITKKITLITGRQQVIDLLKLCIFKQTMWLYCMVLYYRSQREAHVSLIQIK